MDDSYIIELFFARDEDAIHTAQQQYGAYCTAIAQNILSDPGAAEECVNVCGCSAGRLSRPSGPGH